MQSLLGLSCPKSISMIMSSLMSAWGDSCVKSSCMLARLYVTLNVNIKWIVSHEETGERVSQQSTPQNFIPPCGKIQASCLSRDPSGLIFFNVQISLRTFLHCTLDLREISNASLVSWSLISFSVTFVNSLKSCSFCTSLNAQFSLIWTDDRNAKG